VCRPRNSENTLRIPPPGKRPDAAPSAGPPGSRCLQPCKPSVLSAVSACRRSQDQGARPPPLTRPRAPFKWIAVARKSTSEALPKDRPSVDSALVRESASFDTRPLTEVNTPPRDKGMERHPGLLAPGRSVHTQARLPSSQAVAASALRCGHLV
jgi:hypothetical protein